MVNLKEAGLADFGKPEGYTQRQVDGWIKDISRRRLMTFFSMEAEWLASNLPEQQYVSLIHNDYKYDNLVLNPNDLSDVKAVLDWEMATVGNQ